jgi:hypothetical protein
VGVVALLSVDLSACANNSGKAHALTVRVAQTLGVILMTLVGL